LKDDHQGARYERPNNSAFESPEDKFLMFIGSIALVRTLPCLAEPGKLIVIGRPDCSLAAVIPYLAALPGVLAYQPATLALTFRRPRGYVTIYPDKVYITQVDHVAEGLALLEALRDAINATWESRDELTTAASARRAPQHLDIYAQLPQTNCQQCGEASCLAFAVQVILRNRDLPACIPLYQDPAFSDRKKVLEAMI